MTIFQASLLSLRPFIDVPRSYDEYRAYRDARYNGYYRQYEEHEEQIWRSIHPFHHTGA